MGVRRPTTRSKTAIAEKLHMSRNTVDRLLGLEEPPRYDRARAGSRCLHRQHRGRARRENPGHGHGDPGVRPALAVEKAVDLGPILHVIHPSSLGRLDPRIDRSPHVMVDCAVFERRQVLSMDRRRHDVHSTCRVAGVLPASRYSLTRSGRSRKLCRRLTRTN